MQREALTDSVEGASADTAGVSVCVCRPMPEPPSSPAHEHVTQTRNEMTQIFLTSQTP